jgi:hypothetical protein
MTWKLKPQKELTPPIWPIYRLIWHQSSIQSQKHKQANLLMWHPHHGCSSLYDCIQFIWFTSLIRLDGMNLFTLVYLASGNEFSMRLIWMLGEIVVSTPYSFWTISIRWCSFLFTQGHEWQETFGASTVHGIKTFTKTFRSIGRKALIGSSNFFSRPCWWRITKIIDLCL